MARLARRGKQMLPSGMAAARGASLPHGPWHATNRAMIVARTRAALSAALQDIRRNGAEVALVPTMGALHEGHLALVRIAHRHGTPAASIFVNPTQFGPGEDFARYPRDENADLEKLRAAGCALAWLPDAATMYPPGHATMIDVAGPALGWEGDHRPGHFRGVATVVAALFRQVAPAVAIFGEKDWQQLQVINRMTADLDLPVRIIGAPIVREADGLALSSRNRFLSATGRALAPSLYAALRRAAECMRAGMATAASIDTARDAMPRQLDVEYFALIDGPTMVAAITPAPGARLIAAARLEDVRLLDNLAL
jgi:pantoate--beta-alanine ligase